jgi:hypothetical protein
MAQRTASTTLRNSMRTPSPVRFTTRPLCTAMVGSIRSLRRALSRASVRSSSDPASLLSVDTIPSRRRLPRGPHRADNIEPDHLIVRENRRLIRRVVASYEPIMAATGNINLMQATGGASMCCQYAAGCRDPPSERCRLLLTIEHTSRQSAELRCNACFNLQPIFDRGCEEFRGSGTERNQDCGGPFRLLLPPAHKIPTKAIPSITGIQFWKWTPKIENSSTSHCPI